MHNYRYRIRYEFDIVPDALLDEDRGTPRRLILLQTIFPVFHQAFGIITIYDPCRNDKHGCVQFWNFYFPVPAKLTYFLFPTSHIHFVKRHPL